MTGALRGRVGGVGAGCVAAILMSFAAWPSAAQAAPRCVVRGHGVAGVRTSRIVERTGEVIVYRTRPISEEYGPQYTDVWACDRRSNQFVLVAVEEFEQEYGTEGVLRGFHVAGTWLIAVQETGSTGFTECEKYGGNEQDCPRPTESLLLVDTANGLEGSGPAIGVATPVWLSADGALAWLLGQETQQAASTSLRACVAARAKRGLVCRPRQVAQGAISAASVHLAGKTLSWSAAGQPQSSLL